MRGRPVCRQPSSDVQPARAQPLDATHIVPALRSRLERGPTLGEVPFRRRAYPLRGRQRQPDATSDLGRRKIQAVEGGRATRSVLS
jgi:hypothetical protein